MILPAVHVAVAVMVRMDVVKENAVEIVGVVVIVTYVVGVVMDVMDALIEN